MSVSDLYVRNANVVTDEREFVGGVTVADGLIREVVTGNPARHARETIDAVDVSGQDAVP